MKGVLYVAGAEYTGVGGGGGVVVVVVVVVVGGGVVVVVVVGVKYLMGAYTRTGAGA